MNPLISVVRAQQAINRSSWPVAETDRVATLIGVISQAAEKWARRKFKKTTHDLILSYQRDPLWLPNGPIHQIVSITEGSSLRSGRSFWAAGLPIGAKPPHPRGLSASFTRGDLTPFPTTFKRPSRSGPLLPIGKPNKTRQAPGKARLPPPLASFAPTEGPFSHE